MCVIIYSPTGTEVSDETLKQAWERNGDGAGFVACSPGEKQWNFKKGIMDYDELLKELAPYRDKEAAFILHLRIKSRGDINAAMTHPFDFSRKEGERRFLFHNGTVKFFTGSTGCSDSGMLAQFIRPIGNNSVKAVLDNLTKEHHGRFVSFVQNGDATPVINIFEDDESKTKDGVWFSNLKHEEPKVVVTHYGNSHYSGYAPVRTPVQNAPADPERTKLTDAIIDYYIKYHRYPNNAEHRRKITEYYSIKIMCVDFLKKIVESIEADPDDLTNDHIIEFFKL